MKKTFVLTLVLALLLAQSPVLSVSVSDFTDVDSGNWFYSAVEFCVSRELFLGTSATDFSPHGSMNRGMFVTVLGRVAGVPSSVPDEIFGVITASGVNLRSQPNTGAAILTVISANTRVTILGKTGDWFNVRYNSLDGYIRGDLMREELSSLANIYDDVPDSKYYYPYVLWAHNKSISTGTTETMFFPDLEITREQICTFLYNYACSGNYKIKSTVARTKFNDDTKISVWARDAVYAMQEAGVVYGKDGGIFDPSAGATRAEVAAMIERFVGVIAYEPEPEPYFDTNGSYIYGTALPSTAYVDDDYYRDACFIGHSFIDGMESLDLFPNADFYGVNGISAAGILSYNSFSYSDVTASGQAVTKQGKLSDALAANSYAKAYIMLGTNELGGTADTFYSNISKVVELVRNTQPDAVIYIMAVTPVSRLCSETSAAFNRDNIIAFNSKLKLLSETYRVVYLDTFSLFCDSDGFLPGSDVVIHINAAQYNMLREFLKSHAIDLS